MKYRIWDKVNKEMIYSDDPYYTDRNCCLRLFKNNFWIFGFVMHDTNGDEYFKEIIGTGLNDGILMWENKIASSILDVDVYEGDIIDIEDDTGDYTYYSTFEVGSEDDCGSYFCGKITGNKYELELEKEREENQKRAEKAIIQQLYYEAHK